MGVGKGALSTCNSHFLDVRQIGKWLKTGSLSGYVFISISKLLLLMYYRFVYFHSFFENVL